MKIKDIFTPEPQCIEPEASLADAAARMKKWDVGILPVCKDQRVIGALTDRDIVIRAVAEGLAPKAVQVSHAMSDDIFCCFVDQTVEEAAEIMAAARIRRLPVLDREKRLVGIVSLGDVVIRHPGNEIAARVLRRVFQRLKS